MYKFDYRSARFPTDLPVTFNGSHGQVYGTCTQISRDGMEVYLADGQRFEVRGRIAVSHKQVAIELEVHVAHASENRCGVKFLYRTEREKIAMDRLIAGLSDLREASSV